jgi:hypothetical protein
MIKEISLDGIFFPPLIGYLVGAAVVWYLLRYLLGRIGFYRLVWHPPLFNTALYVIVLGVFVVATL